MNQHTRDNFVIAAQLNALLPQLALRDECRLAAYGKLIREWPIPLDAMDTLIECTTSFERMLWYMFDRWLNRQIEHHERAQIYEQWLLEINR